MDEEAKKILLNIARKGVRDGVKGVYEEPDGARLPEELRRRKGVFVTLEKKGDLRGCIGEIWPKNPLYLGTYIHAIDAAIHDPRFPPVREEEFPYIEVEVTVLSIPKLLPMKGRAVLERLVPFRHGVVIKKGWFLATYLPQVWEHFPEKEEFMKSLAMKAGLMAEEWVDADVYVYEAEEIIKGRLLE